MSNHVTLGAMGDNTATGWTSITPSTIAGGDTFDTNIIYVSDSTGDDTWDGSQPAHTTGIHGPVKTLIKAVGGSGPGVSTATNGGDHTGLGTKGAGNNFAFRTGHPDWILLKEGDTWTDQSFETGLADNFGKGGLSSSEPMVISSYDPSQPGVMHPAVGARPLILVPNNKRGFYFIGGLGGDRVALIGLDLYAYTRDPANGAYVGAGNELDNCGLFFNAPFNWFLVEDCRIRFFGTNVSTAAVPSMLNSGGKTMVSAQWTQGSGWSIAAGVATAASASSALTEVIATTNGTTYRIGYIITVSAGTLTLSVGGNPGITRAVSGAYMEDIVAGGANVTFTGVGFSGTIVMVYGYPVVGGTLVFRRNVVSDAIMPGVINNGISLYGVIGSALLEENLLNRNGSIDTRCRNLYIGRDTQNVTYRRNISANSGSEGVQFRTGGFVYDSLFVRNTNGFDLGHFEGTTVTTYSEAYDNVVLEPIDGQIPAGTGIVFMNSTGANVYVHNNIIAHCASANPTNAFPLQTDAFAANGGVDIAPGGTGRFDNVSATGTNGTHGVRAINNIIYDWPHGVVDLGSSDGHGAANTFSNAVDLTGANTANYPRPGGNFGTVGREGSNSVGSYHASIGGTATTDAFLNLAENQCKFSWDVRYTAHEVNNYIRAGFGLFPGHKSIKGGF